MSKHLNTPIPLQLSFREDEHCYLVVKVPNDREWIRSVKSCLYLLSRGRFWAGDSRYNSIRDASKIGYSIFESICMICDEIATASDINLILESIAELSRSMEDMQITVSPQISLSSGCGCGCKDETVTDPITDPSDDPIADPSDDNPPIDGEHLEYRCKACHLAVDQLSGFWVNAKNNSTNLTTFVSVMSGIVALMPALKAHALTLSGISVFIGGLSSLLPLDEIADYIDQNKSQLVCTIYSAPSALAGRDAFVNYLYNTLVTGGSMQLDTWAGLRLSIDLIDWDGIYTNNQIDTSGVIPVGGCAECDQPSPPEPVDEPDLSDGLPQAYNNITADGYCMTFPTFITKVGGDGGIRYRRVTSDSFYLAGTANNQARIAIGRPSVDVVGLIFNVSTPSGSGSGSVTFSNNDLYDNNGLISTSSFTATTGQTVALENGGIADPSIVDHADTGSDFFQDGASPSLNEIWVKLNTAGGVLIRDIRYVYDCSSVSTQKPPTDHPFGQPPLPHFYFKALPISSITSVNGGTFSQVNNALHTEVSSTHEANKGYDAECAQPAPANGEFAGVSFVSTSYTGGGQDIGIQTGSASISTVNLYAQPSNESNIWNVVKSISELSNIPTQERADFISWLSDNESSFTTVKRSYEGREQDGIRILKNQGTGTDSITLRYWAIMYDPTVG